MQGSGFGLKVSVLGLSASVWGIGLGVEGLGFRTASRTRGSDDLRIGTFQGLGFRSHLNLNPKREKERERERERERKRKSMRVCVRVCARVCERESGQGRAPVPRSQSHLSGAGLQGPITEIFVIDNLVVRIHFIIVMIWWTGVAP